MSSIIILSIKGGNCKTTTATLLAVQYCYNYRLRTNLIDLDDPTYNLILNFSTDELKLLEDNPFLSISDPTEKSYRDNILKANCINIIDTAPSSKMFSDEVVELVEKADVVICPSFIENQELRALKEFTIPPLLEVDKEPVVLLTARSSAKSKIFSEVKKELEELFENRVTVVSSPVSNMNKFLDEFKTSSIDEKIKKVRSIKAIQELSGIINNKIIKL